ncbi:MAG: cytochrome c-type biosis protein [Clostridia bacterium]|nr:cytochrome c-type biosis protein [Clostridia bacterium]
MDGISVFVAFGTGLLTFISPCIIPLIPVYLTYLGGTSELTLSENRYRLLGRAAAFTAGFAFIFILLGFSAGALGSFFFAYRKLVRQIGGLLIILLGLQTAGILKIPWLLKLKKWEFRPQAPTVTSSFLMGMAFGTGWTPCVGPVLASILIYAGSQGIALKGAVLLGLYSLGLGLPFLILAITISWSRNLLQRFSRYLPYITMASGILLVLFGILVFFNRLQDLGGLL